jgi:acetolactate synthase I/II/III large subunit
VVLNNQALGNVWLRAHQEGTLPAELTTIPDHDWAGFARSLGAKGMTVDDPAALAAAFTQALATESTVVIDVKTDKDSRRRSTILPPARALGPTTNRA